MKKDKEQEIEKKCPQCYGYGWWPMGGLSPLGPMDGREWEKLSVKCPWCGAGVRRDARYKALKEYKEKEDEKKIRSDK